jgi:hypothetical protein
VGKVPAPPYSAEVDINDFYKQYKAENFDLEQSRHRRLIVEFEAGKFGRLIKVFGNHALRSGLCSFWADYGK